MPNHHIIRVERNGDIIYRTRRHGSEFLAVVLTDGRNDPIRIVDESDGPWPASRWFCDALTADQAYDLAQLLAAAAIEARGSGIPSS